MLTEITRDDYERIQKHDVAGGPLVTIIVPVFNMNPVLLRRCVLSLTGQTYRNLEILLVDDGSQLASCIDCLHDLEREDERIRVIWNEHGGVSRARNVGIDQARGSWIAFADADDSVWEHFVERAVQLEQSTKADFVMGRVCYIFRDGNEELGAFERGYLITDDTDLSSFRRTMLSQCNTERKSRFRFYPPRGPVAKLYRSEGVKQIRFDENLAIAEDVYFNYQYLQHCSRAAAVDEDWYYYYQYAGSADHSSTIAPWKSSLEALDGLNLEVQGDRPALLSRLGFTSFQGAQALFEANGLARGWRGAKTLLEFACEYGAFDVPSFDGFVLSKALSVIVPLCFKRHLNLACLAIYAKSILGALKNGNLCDLRENQ